MADRESRKPQDTSSAAGVVEILGQRIPYPRNLFETTAVVVFFLMIGFIAAVLLWWGNPDNIERFGASFQSGKYTGSGLVEGFGDSFCVHFWTPSAKTLLAAEVDPWERVSEADIDKKLEEFGNKLRGTGLVLGYRRTEVFGHGRTNAKWGWWWVVTAKRDLTEVRIASIYQEFWGTDKPVYLEIYESNYRHIPGKK